MLQQLIGHEVWLTLKDETEESGVPPGTLKAVDSYQPYWLVIQTKAEEDGGTVQKDAEFYVRVDQVVTIVHPGDCTACVVAAAIRFKATGR